MITLEFFPADYESAKSGFLIPHDSEKPFVVTCEECELETVIKKQITGFNAYVINYFVGGRKMGVKYEGHPFYTFNGKIKHPISAAKPSLKTVADKILSSCKFYNGISDMTKTMINDAREKPQLTVI